MKARRALAAAVILAAVTFAGGLEARADTITPSLTSISAGPGPFTWTYQAVFTGVGFELTAGSFFTIFDFGNYIPGTETTHTDWTFSLTTPIASPGTDTAAANLTWTYIGPTLTGSAAVVTFTGFSAMSSSGIATVDEYVSQDSLTGGGLAPPQTGPVLVPTPEPSALLLLGAGLLAIAFRSRRPV